MKSRTLFGTVILVLIIICAITPLIDGYLFKRIYYRYIGLFQEILQTRKPMQIRIDSYDLGWLKSTANLTIYDNNGYDIFHVKSIIHHGPFVYFQNKLHIAYATIATSIDLPESLKHFLTEKKLMQINSQVALNGDTWKSHYVVPAPLLQKFGSWNGLSGDLVINTHDGSTRVNNNFIFSKLQVLPNNSGGPDIQIESIEGNGEMTLPSPSIWNSDANVKSAGMLARWQDGSIFSLNNFVMNAIYQSKNNLYTYNIKTSIDNIHLPSPSPITDISKFIYMIRLNDLNVEGLRDVSYQRVSFLKLFSPTSSVEMSVNFNTEIGAASGNFHVSLIALPKTEQEISKNSIYDLNVRVAQPLLNKLLITYITKLPNSRVQNDPSQQTKMIINDLLQQGYIQQDNNDYIIVFTRKNLENTLNNKSISDDDLAKIPATIQQDIMNTIEPANVTPVTPTETTTMNNYHCYWMENHSGKYQWVLMPSMTKSQCFILDSCSGGMKQSGGGCYKWAASPDAKVEPWDTKTPSSQ